MRVFGLTICTKVEIHYGHVCIDFSRSGSMILGDSYSKLSIVSGHVYVYTGKDDMLSLVVRN